MDQSIKCSMKKRIQNQSAHMKKKKSKKKDDKNDD